MSAFYAKLGYFFNPSALSLDHGHHLSWTSNFYFRLSLSLSSVHFSAKDKLAGHERDDERGSAAVVAAKLLLTRVGRHVIQVA